VPTTRLETFADGVFAIAATLLVLNVQLPDHTHALGHELLRLWPSYAAYAVSFLTIGIIWVNHHEVMNQIGRCDRVFLFLTVGFLLCIAFIPFPTRVLAQTVRTGEGRWAAVLYGVVLTLTAAFFNALWLYAVHGGLLREDADPRVVSGITRSYRPGVPLYLTATLVGLASAAASASLYTAIALFYVLSSARFGQSPP
jgi:uncharacterized membrane protein